MVLIVDDESQIRHALSLNLGARGYEVLEAATGEEALAIVSTRLPDVVLLDIGLPGMDGLMVLRALRKQTDAAVIMLTVRDDERSRSESFEAGADDYVTKPFDMAVLVERIGIALSGRAGARPSSPEILTD
jgi:two-component system, OmpR family, KDP operon response regulator KdpE